MILTPQMRLARAKLWAKGILSPWMLHSGQLEVYAKFLRLPKHVRQAVFLISRRWGKSFLGIVIALEFCLRHPGSQVFIAGPSFKHVSQIVLPLFKIVTADAPEGLLKHNKSDYRWHFHNGSTLILGSFDTAIERFRGSFANLIILEESGFAPQDEYDYTIKSVLMPTLLHSQGKILHLTTPSPILDHPLHIETMPEADLADALFIYDIYTNPLLTIEQIEAEAKTVGGKESIHWQREYLCKLVRDGSLVICPEFDSDIFVKPITLPRWMNTWVAGDFGGVRDKTANYRMGYDFERNKVLVLGERAHPAHTTTAEIVKGLRELEAMTPNFEIKGRWIDAPGQVLTDLRVDHQYLCSLPMKDDFDAGINQMRAAFTRNQVEIDPECRLLITTLRSGTFNKQRTDYSRTEALGHCDAAAALIYGLRHKYTENPIPRHLGLHRETHYMRPEDETREGLGALIS